MKSPSILICRLAPLENMGVMATLMGLLIGIRNFMPDANIVVLSYLPEKYEYLEKLGIKLIQHPWWRPWGKLWFLSSVLLIPYDYIRCALFRILKKFNKRIVIPYSEYDVVIDNNTEHLNESLYGSTSVTISLLQTLLASLIFARPLVTTPSSAGPFITTRNKWLAKRILNRVDLLALREKNNYQYCLDLGIDISRIHFVSDPGFLLEPSDKEKVYTILNQEGIVKNDKPLICFSPNWLEMNRFSFGESVSIEERQEMYVRLMTTTVDYTIDKLDANVCLLSHMYGGLLSDNKNDDRYVNSLIYNELKNKNKTTIIRGKYMPDELKGIIGNCDMFIGGRMHATIASTSLCVPTITFAYGDKYYRIIGDTMGQAGYIIDLREPNYDEILQETKNKIDSLWENRESISEILKEKTKQVKQIALYYPRLIENIIKKYK
ncbi:MAG: polysaccharide pyruvyl transferase family protein [Dehalococcoidales bacterium]|nr:polysaccharide pyruvyl transferase family protein [Dehalococcoidales bacterium]